MLNVTPPTALTSEPIILNVDTSPAFAQAISQINTSGPGAATINLAASFGLAGPLPQIALASGQTLLIVGGATTATGDPATTITGDGASRIFYVASGAVTIQNLILTGGSVSGAAGGDSQAGTGSGGGGGGGAALGGALFVADGGTLTLIDTVTSSNLVTGGAAGVCNGSNGNPGNPGAGVGSGIFFQSGAALTIQVNAGSGSGQTSSGKVAFTTDTLASDGSSTLVKTGAGTLVLATPATYDGQTQIAAGTVHVATANGSALGRGPITVAAGATLAGAGTFVGPVQVSGSLDVASVMNFNAGLTLSSGSTVAIPLGATAAVTCSALTTEGNVTVTVTLPSSAGAGSYPLLSVDGLTGDPALWTVDAPAGYGGGVRVSGGTLYVDVFQSAAPGVYNVTSAADDGSIGTLRDAVAKAGNGDATTIAISSAVGTITLGRQLFVAAPCTLALQGSGNTIQAAAGDRIFFLGGGDISISNLTLSGGSALGGDGGGGGGGGAGLGGAIFVANGASIPGGGLANTTHLTLQNVTLAGNSAAGGNGSGGSISGDSIAPPPWGGGGGMGGDGGIGNVDNKQSGACGGGGGGGFGAGADGGDASDGTPGPGGTGAFPTAGAAGAGGNPPDGGGDDAGAPGGAFGGGGGGASNQGFDVWPGNTWVTGGGGGVGGVAGNANSDGSGGAGGWGGGGGGGGANANGGFGGGGGAWPSNGSGQGSNNAGATGGFGGGGSGIQYAGGQAPGGFAGGAGSCTDSGVFGGGGAGLGGAIFVHLGATVTIIDGCFSGNATSAGANASQGQGSKPGLAGGAALFLGGDATFMVSAGNTVTLTEDIGGGAIDSSHATDPDAQGGLTVDGAGTLTLVAANTFTGPTLVTSGVLNITGSVAASACTVQTGGTLAGSGSVGALTIGAGGTLAPGVPGSVGQLSGASLVLLGGGNYNWPIFNPTAAAGTGYATVALSGALDLTQLTAAQPFQINLWTLSGLNPAVSGPLAGFDPTQSQFWPLITAAGGIQGFLADLFALNLAPANGTGGFATDLAGGTFSVSEDNNTLALVFTPAPTS